MLREIIHVPNKGVILAVYAPSNNISKKDIHFIDLKGKLVWSIKPKYQQLKFGYQAIVASEYTDYTYLFESDWELSPTKNAININRIDKTGQLSTFEIPVEKELEKSQPIALFSNEHGLNMLFAKGFAINTNLIEKDPKPKERPLVLYFLSHQSKSLIKIPVDMSTMAKKFEQDLGIEFLDSDNDHFYLATTEVDKEEKVLAETVYKVNLEGKVVHEKIFDVNLDYLPSITSSHRNFEGNYSLSHERRLVYETDLVKGYEYFESGYSNLRLDLKNGFVYIYGLQHEPNPASTEENYIKMSPTHYYLYKYNLETEELLQSQKGKLPNLHDYPTKSSDLIYFCAHLHLSILDSQNVAFTIYSS